jgi:hypothetical protein
MRSGHSPNRIRCGMVAEKRGRTGTASAQVNRKAHGCNHLIVLQRSGGTNGHR